MNHLNQNIVAGLYAVSYSSGVFLGELAQPVPHHGGEAQGILASFPLTG